MNDIHISDNSYVDECNLDKNVEPKCSMSSLTANHKEYLWDEKNHKGWKVPVPNGLGTCSDVHDRRWRPKGGKCPLNGKSHGKNFGTPSQFWIVSFFRLLSVSSSVPLPTMKTLGISFLWPQVRSCEIHQSCPVEYIWNLTLAIWVNNGCNLSEMIRYWKNARQSWHVVDV